LSDSWEFTSDWVHWKPGFWQNVAEKIHRRAASILEIGSWEGRFAIAWLNLVPNGKITCVSSGLPDRRAASCSRID
jgi:hypothetical protein